MDSLILRNSGSIQSMDDVSIPMDCNCFASLDILEEEDELMVMTKAQLPGADSIKMVNAKKDDTTGSVSVVSFNAYKQKDQHSTSKQLEKRASLGKSSKEEDMSFKPNEAGSLLDKGAFWVNPSIYVQFDSGVSSDWLVDGAEIKECHLWKGSILEGERKQKS
ncbi:unnamed protein product [Dovyalis caffra]|uniref:Uncharacterized protein n=1 Tax=Dovyalis caffra TaxID=77055 RepID=A0AAV1RFE4_9ROSI|nr:unnamed protein product [Dovyalis caffra]